MATNCIEGPTVFTELAAEWDGLAERGMTNTPFQTLAYQKSWWTHLHPENATLFTFITRNEDGALKGIACFYLIDNTLHFNGCIEETDYLDLISAEDDAAQVWSEVLFALDKSSLPDSLIIDLCNIPEKSPTREVLAEVGPDHGYTVQESIIEVCPVITLPESFDVYLDNLDSKQRRETSRKLRRAEGAGVTNTIVGADEDVHEAVDEFLELLQSSTFEKRDWLNDGRRAHFHEVAEAAQKAGTLQLMFSAVEGDRAAGLFNFDYDDRIWVYNSGLDPAKYGSLSMGVVLTAAAIENAIETGQHSFDFLRGNEEYKYRLGAVDTAVYRIVLAKP